MKLVEAAQLPLTIERDMPHSSPLRAAMIARAALGRPWIFQQAQAALRGEPIPPDPTLQQQRECMVHHYRLVVERFGEAKGTQLMRKFACCYAQGRFGARHFRTHVAYVATPAEFHRVVDEYFPTT